MLRSPLPGLYLRLHVCTGTYCNTGLVILGIQYLYGSGSREAHLPAILVHCGYKCSMCVLVEPEERTHTEYSHEDTVILLYLHYGVVTVLRHRLTEYSEV